MKVERSTCPLCGRGPRDRTLVTFANGMVHCHRDCDWRVIRDALGERWTSPPVAADDLPSGQRWSAKANWTWTYTKPLEDSPVARYLAWRGVPLPTSGEVRYASARGVRGCPAMVARITDAITGEPLSLHFTRIRADGQGKAPVEPQRLFLKGHVKGGGVARLCPDSATDGALAVAEGIETALAFHRMTGLPVWAALDAGNLANLPILPDTRLTVAADHDPAGLKAADRLMTRWRRAGRLVDMAIPPRRGTDWADELAEDIGHG